MALNGSFNDVQKTYCDLITQTSCRGHVGCIKSHIFCSVNTDLPLCVPTRLANIKKLSECTVLTDFTVYANLLKKTTFLLMVKMHFFCI